ncbi:MAG: macro domain-containing protein [Gemmatimonadota bacterium]
MSGRIRVVTDDIARVETEAVLRSVGSDLEPIAAVGRRIEQAAGAEILERLGRVGELPTGGAVVTPAGGLSADFLIHVVTRSSDEPVTEGSLHRALLNGLRRAMELEIRRLAVPPLGTGAGNLNAEASATVMVSTLREHFALSVHPAEVLIVVANEYEREAFQREVDRQGAAAGEEA